MPAGRLKHDHGVGAVCKFTLNITDSPYTGVLKDGLQTGIIRISLPGLLYGDTYNPETGIKFLRSGVPSANFVTMTDFSSPIKTNNNIFDPHLHRLHNHILDFSIFYPTGETLPKQTYYKLKQGDACPSLVGLSHLGRYRYLSIWSFVNLM